MKNMSIKVLTHSSIKIECDKTIYVDPYDVKGSYKDADIIFITHSHYDHFSPEDIEKIRKDNTILVYPKSMEKDVLKNGYESSSNISVKPYDKKCVAGIEFQAVPAYNVGKKFHPKRNEWVGYILEIEGENIYVCGDTDVNSDIEKINCDVALVPVGGTYTMTATEAAGLVNTLKPRVAIPTHYGSVVGNKNDGDDFKKLVNSEIKVDVEW